MEQKKAVWTQKQDEFGNQVLIKDGITQITFRQYDEIRARLNATEGLDTSALPELIEAARAGLAALETAKAIMNMDTLAISQLESALAKITGGKK